MFVFLGNLEPKHDLPKSHENFDNCQNKHISKS